MWGLDSEKEGNGIGSFDSDWKIWKLLKRS